MNRRGFFGRFAGLAATFGLTPKEPAKHVLTNQSIVGSDLKAYMEMGGVVSEEEMRRQFGLQLDKTNILIPRE